MADAGIMTRGYSDFDSPTKDAVQYLGKVGRALVMALSDAPLETWDARKTIDANRWGLVKLGAKNRLVLTARGRRVAAELKKKTGSTRSK